MLRKIFSWIVLVCFLLTSVVGPDTAHAQALDLPLPGAMVMPAPDLMPVMMKGLKVHPEDPLLFDFIMDTGKSGLKADGQAFKAESERLVKYFLASLAIKDENMWVNLSPIEDDRVIADDLGRTILGRDMLAQDYVLKQLTASLIYPEKELGKTFWAKVYAKAQEKFGTTDIPVDTFNKVWITGDRAKIVERNNVGYVVGMHLKVMLESDYEAAGHPERSEGSQNSLGRSDVAKQILREVIIPELEQQVNAGAHFAPLRQIFSAMILASWYKKALKDALLNQVYTNKGKTDGVQNDDPTMKEKIYARYLEAYRKGVFDYIKDETDQSTGEVTARKYFSGGLDPAEALRPEVAHDLAPGDDTFVAGEMVAVMAEIRPEVRSVRVGQLEGAVEKGKPAVLFIDDDEKQRMVWEEQSRWHPGYHFIVMGFEDGLKYIENGQGPFDGVVTDTDNFKGQVQGWDIARAAIDHGKSVVAIGAAGDSMKQKRYDDVLRQMPAGRFSAISKFDIMGQLKQTLQQFDHAEYEDLRRSPLVERLSRIAEVSHTGKGGYTLTQLTVEEYLWWQIGIAQALVYAWNRMKRNDDLDLERVRFLGLAKDVGVLPFSAYFKDKISDADKQERAIRLLERHGVDLDEGLKTDLRALGDGGMVAGAAVSQEAKLVLIGKYWANVLKRIFVGISNQGISITVDDKGKLRYPAVLDEVDFPQKLILELAHVGKQVGNVSSWDNGLFDPIMDHLFESIFADRDDIEVVLRKAKRVSDMIDGLIPLADNSGPQDVADLYRQRMERRSARALSALRGEDVNISPMDIMEKLVQLTDDDLKKFDDAEVLIDGGIDLDMRKTAIDVARDGEGVPMTFDPAMAEKFRHEGFTGVVPVILKITQVKGPLFLLGLEK